MATRGTKTSKLTLYMTPELHDLLLTEAAKRGQNLGPWLISLGQQAVEHQPIERELMLQEEELTEARVMAKEAADQVAALRAERVRARLLPSRAA